MTQPARPRSSRSQSTGWLDDPLRPQNPLVSRNWILAGVAIMLGVAALLGYGCLALLYWQGQWQLLFHPSHTVLRTPADAGLPYRDIPFDVTETGKTQLDGWWIPALAVPSFEWPAAHAKNVTNTVLYLHGATGSLSDAVPEIAALHALNANVFAFDYRGYGKSAWVRPSERDWTQDAEAAFALITSPPYIAHSPLIVAGSGYGAAVAAELAARHPEIAGLILINPQPPSIQALGRDPRSRFVPFRLLARDRFDPAPELQSLRIPKLLIATPATPQPVPYAAIAAAPTTVLRADAPPGESPLADPAIQKQLRLFMQTILASELAKHDRAPASPGVSSR